MPLPRRRRGDCSPITQRIASTTLDLPQPFGPTTAVMPSRNSSVVRSTKDLKPKSSRDLRRKPGPLAAVARPRGRRGGRVRRRPSDRVLDAEDEPSLGVGEVYHPAGGPRKREEPLPGRELQEPPLGTRARRIG